MKDKNINIVCEMIGHSIDPMEPECWTRECFRCGETFNGGQKGVRDDTAFWLWYWDLQRCLGRRSRFLVWWKCPDCKGRFGRHTDQCSDLPF